MDSSSFRDRYIPGMRVEEEEVKESSVCSRPNVSMAWKLAYDRRRLDSRHDWRRFQTTVDKLRLINQESSSKSISARKSRSESYPESYAQRYARKEPKDDPPCNQASVINCGSICHTSSGTSSRRLIWRYVKESSLSSHLHDSSNRMPSTFNLARKMMKWDVPSGLFSSANGIQLMDSSSFRDRYIPGMRVEEEEVKESSLSSHLHDSSNRMPSTFNLARKEPKDDPPCQGNVNC